MSNKTYECTEVDMFEVCQNWEIVENNEVLPPLSQAEQTQLTIAIISVMALVWLFKMLKRAI